MDTRPSTPPCPENGVDDAGRSHRCRPDRPGPPLPALVRGLRRHPPGTRPRPRRPQPAALELPAPGAPVVFPGNFPDEAFYFSAEAEMLVGGPAGSARARLILALEAAFGGTGAVVDGQQMVFGRIRLRIDDVEPGRTYTATGPYGVIA